MKNKPKVDIVVKYFFPITAGIEVNVMETYRRMAERGIDITLHTSKDMYIEKNVLKDEEMMNGIKVKRYPFKWYGYFPKIDYENTDLVCLHNFDIFPHFHVLLYTFWLKLIGKRKFAVIETPHGGFNPEWRIFSPLQVLIKKTYHYTIGSLLINLACDGVRAVSDWEKNEMIVHLLKPKLINVITNGIEDEAYADVDKKASEKIKKQVAGFGRYLIQIGRIYRIKNYETVIKALAKLPDDVNYVIAGPVQDNDEYLHKLQNLIQELGLEKRVHFIGVIKGVDKYYLIRKSQMMVHMALWESYCNVVHEGLSQGKVCIVADNTALPLLIKNDVNGYCVETTDDVELAKKINFVLKNKNTKKIQDMEKRNQEIGLQNSWEQVSQKLQEWDLKLIKKYDKHN